ncbi:MAG: hypothetical protein PVH93_08800 [Nitrosopumilaceae archaeon]|jgi:hypothetical protein
MGSRSIDVHSSESETFSKIQEAIGTTDYKIKSVEANKSLIAEGNREFSWAIVIILAILIWPAAIVYYFTRQRSSVTVIVTPDSDRLCKVTINSNGKTGDHVLQTIVNNLE